MENGSKRLDAEIEVARREHALRCGEITIAWAQLHIHLQLLYSRLLTANGYSAEAMRQWARKRSDDGQRKMLRNALVQRRDELPIACDAISWACDRVDELASIRNGFVHLAITFIMGLKAVEVRFEEQLYLDHNEDRFREIKERPDENYNVLRADLLALSAFLQGTLDALIQPDKFSCPEKPKLLMSADK